MASTTRALPNGREFALEFHRRAWVEPHGLEWIVSQGVVYERVALVA